VDGAAAIAFAHACRDAAPMFIEEPVWPPEDFATLAEVRPRRARALRRARMPARCISSGR
jgi:L-alanine-DL-glutamate epimerase-like enolase superfamily enzyme